MNQEAKRNALREFFTAPRPVLHPRTLVIGGCLVFLGLLSSVSGDFGPGVLAVGAGAAILAFLPTRTRAGAGESLNEAMYVSLLRYPAAMTRFEDRLDADTVTGWLVEELNRVEARSGEALRLDQDETTRDPICVVGPLYSDTVTGIASGDVLRRRVPDGYLYSAYRVSVFHFTDRFLAYYQVNLSLLDGSTTAEQAGELFYKNVVAVRTFTDSSHAVLKSGEALERSTTFLLTTTGTDRIQVILDDPAIRSSHRIRSLGEEAADNIRAMVRQFKGAPVT